MSTSSTMFVHQRLQITQPGGGECDFTRDPLPPAYHIYVELPLLGPLDVGRLEEALAAVEKCHEILSVAFETEYSNLYMVRSSRGFTLSRSDLREAMDAQQEIREDLLQFTSREFDLRRGPVWRGKLYQLGQDDHVLALAIHHIAADGESVDMIVNDLATAFNGGNLAVRPSTYAAFAAKQLDDLKRASEKLEFWKEELLAANMPVRSREHEHCTCRPYKILSYGL